MMSFLLGQILLDQGFIDDSELDYALDRQRRMQSDHYSQNFLGEILIQLGMLTYQQLAISLRRQATTLILAREYLAPPPTAYQPRVDILNITLNNLTRAEFLRRFTAGVCFTPNVDHLMKLQHDPEFLDIYQQADYKVCDSQILMYASYFLGKPIKEKISGSDLFPAFYAFHRYNPDIKIFLLGGVEGAAQQAQENINTKMGRQMVVGAHCPPFGFEKDEDECQKIIDLINRAQPTVLAVGVGAPKQEKWIAKYKDQLPSVKIFLAVGATINFEAGMTRRSPQWLSQIGLEWLYRIYCEPKRLWRRYLVEDLPFLWLVVMQKMGIYQPSTSTSR